MSSWFDDKFNREEVHRTKPRLGSWLIRNFFSNLSITTWIIIINVILFFIFTIIISIKPDFISYIALKPSDIFHLKNIWTLITSMFMHAGLGHLFVNMFSLYFIGSFVERLIGRKRYLRFYLASGIIAGLFFSLLSWYFGGILPGIFSTPETIAVGASGALFGLVGVLAVLTPKARVYLILGPLVAVILESIFQIFLSTSVSGILSVILNIYFFVSIFAIFSFNPRIRRIAFPVEMPFWILPIVAIVPLIVIGLFVVLPIGNTAHLGGLIAGLIYGWYLRSKYKKKIKLLDKMLRRQ